MDRAKSDAADEYMNKVIKRLETEGFEIESNIKYKGQCFDYFAKIKRFHIDKLNYVFTIFIFSRFSSLDVNTLKNFSSDSFKYAVSSTIKPLSRNLFCGRFCYPVAVVDKTDYLTTSYIRKNALPMHILK